MPNKQSILLIIGGGIAAYKCLELIRLCKQQDIDVTAVLTKAGEEFITPLSVATLTENQVFTDLFDLKDETEIGHIQLSRSADLVVVAPATADLMAKMATGLANDLASTLLLATDKEVLIAPAMNVRMWEHAATQRNVTTLNQDGVHFIGPNEGDMACGETGMGRMAEPEEILGAIKKNLVSDKSTSNNTPLAGKHVLITAGPTHEPIDPVRVIANRSSGKQGYAIAEQAREFGAEVTLISGPTKLAPPKGIKFIAIETAEQMHEATIKALPADVFIAAAAVADWRVKNAPTQKLKKSKAGFSNLEFEENPDILKSIASLTTKRPELVIGFAAETENVRDFAQEKLKKKGCDWIVANDVSAESGVMGGDMNRLLIITHDNCENLRNMPKQQAAYELLSRVVNQFKSDKAAAE